jgi:hypothetical protein
MSRLVGKPALAIILSFFCLFLTGKLLADDIKLTNINYKINNKVLMATAKAEFSFDEDVLAALESGITLYFELHIRVVQQRKYLWNAEHHRVKYAFSVRSHALSNQFITTNLVTGQQGVYRSIQLAIDNLGHLGYLAVVDINALTTTSNLLMEMKLALDIESLPAPMIPMAYISRSWHMSSKRLRKSLDL